MRTAMFVRPMPSGAWWSGARTRPTVCPAVGAGNALGVQFHLEKSSRSGVRMLHEFPGEVC